MSRGRHRKPSHLKSRFFGIMAVGLAAGSGSITASAHMNPWTGEQRADLDFKDGEEQPLSSVPQISNAAHAHTVDTAQLLKVLDVEEKARHTNPLNGSQVVLPAVGSYSSGFGPRWGAEHRGVDIANAIGTPILAVMSGEVINAGPASGFGQWIRVRQDDGSITVYGHIETIEVSVGQRVEAGQRIAGMGARGEVTGPHLHFEYYPDGINAIDPEPFLAQFGVFLT